jgi:hypothetical protein
MHLLYGSPVLLIVVIVSVAQVRNQAGTVALRILATSSAVLALFLGALAIRPGVTVETRQGRVRMPEPDRALEVLQQNVAAGQHAFVYPYYPMYYFLANVRNPTRYSVVMYHIHTPQQFAEVIEDLERHRVKVVLWDTAVAGTNLVRWFPGYVDPPADQQLLEHYLRTHYRLVAVENNFRVLERTALAGQGAATSPRDHAR